MAKGRSCLTTLLLIALTAPAWGEEGGLGPLSITGDQSVSVTSSSVAKQIAQATDDLRLIGLALHNYNDSYGSLAACVFGGRQWEANGQLASLDFTLPG